MFERSITMSLCIRRCLIFLLIMTVYPVVSRGQGSDSSEGAKAEQERPERIALWERSAPIGGEERLPVESENANITMHQPVKANGTAVVICPGGGYGGLVVGPEGHGIASWLNGFGITGVVLEYRLPKHRHAVPLLDAQRAIRLVRNRADSLGLDPQRIGIMGFSAGGHLASTAATHFDAGDPSSLDPVERVSCRPDFGVLVYPVVTMGESTHGGSKSNLLGPDPTADLIELYSNEKQVSAETPPIFMAHALDDRPVPIENSRLLDRALRQHGVPAVLLELESGGHGLNGYKGPMWDRWQKDSVQWILSL